MSILQDDYKKYNVIFIDLDGTLLEGKFKHYNLYVDILKRLEKKFFLNLDRYWNLKRNKTNIIKILEYSQATDIIQKFKKSWIEEIESKKYLKYDVLFEGVFEKLLEFKESGFKLILVTQRNNKVNAKWQLENKNILNLFNEVLCCSTINSFSKYEVLKKYKFKNAVLIGDTEVDILTAKKLKISCISIGSGIRNKELLNNNHFYDFFSYIKLNDLNKLLKV